MRFVFPWFGIYITIVTNFVGIAIKDFCNNERATNLIRKFFYLVGSSIRSDLNVCLNSVTYFEGLRRSCRILTDTMMGAAIFS